MKKLILGAAFMLAFAGTAVAQTDNNVQTQTQQPAVTSPVPTTPASSATSQQPASTDMQATPQQPVATTAPATTTEAVADGKEYNKVSQTQIAPAVLKKAVAKYKDYALVEALAAADGTEYKLVLTKDGQDVAAYYKANGDFIREETV